MEGYIKRRSIIKGQVTKLVNNINTHGSEYDYDDLKIRFDKVNKLYNEFVEVEDLIFGVDATAASEMDLIDDQYYHIIPKIQSLLRNESGITNPVNLDQTLNGTTGATATSDFKLPSLSMPTFDGNLADWQSFYDIFTSTVHENTTLSPAQKFKYLKGLLKGNAYNLIRHLRVDDASYVEAFQRLVKRYDKKKSIVESYMKSLFDHPKITKVNSATIASVLDNLDEVIRGLKALGNEAESRDPWLIHIVLQKLDDESRRLWKYETADKDFPPLQTFLDFLIRRMDSLVEAPVENKTVFKQQKSVRTLHVSSDHPCLLCDGKCHKLYECQKFSGMSIDQRREILKTKEKCFNCLGDGHTVYQCRSKRRCKICQRKHNTLVHLNISETFSSTNNSNSKPSTSAHISCSPTNLNELVLTSIVKPVNATLPTVVIQIKDNTNNWREIRGLLDSGSTRSFITESCVTSLGLSRSNSRMLIETINGARAGCSRGVTKVKLRSRINHSFIIDVAALIVPAITSNLPSKTFYTPLEFVESLPLADPTFNKRGSIDILLGCDHFFNILEPKKITNQTNNVVAQDTKFGWIVVGTSEPKEVIPPIKTFLSIGNEINIDELLKRFWELEEIPSNPNYTKEELYCIESFKKNVRRDPNGKLIVHLPFKQNTPNLGNSLKQATCRFYALEKRLLKDNVFRTQYIQFMKEYLQLGHMEPVPDEDIYKNWNQMFYLPHHGVIKESSTTTRLRVVFDGSAKSSNGYSLNDQLLIGPTVQQTLLEILMRFRKHKYVFSADVEKMFRQIMVISSDADYQRILWRDSPTDPLRHYRLLTVTYGTSSAPFLSTFALSHVANQHKYNFPKSAKIIENDFYVDDLMSGADSIDDAVKLQKELIQILQSASFKLRKWSANHPDLLNHLRGDELSLSLREISNGTKMIAILGICYLPLRDVFKFKVKLSESYETTKRHLLSEASKLFDPMGWLTPVTVVVKILFQQLWVEKLEWDDQLPASIRNIWLNFRQELNMIEDLEIDRWLHTSNYSILEIHGFSDASKDAYAAVLYARVVLPQGDVKVTIIAAKSKVAPIKTITIPKLELCAAGLLVKLLQSTLKSLEFESNPKIFLYTDSTIVLNWLSKPPKSWPTFIANRTSQILSYTSRNQWLHVPSQENPADCASRGVSPSEINGCELWWRGPKWLQCNPIPFPNQTIVIDNAEEFTEGVTVSYASINERNQLLTQLFSRVSKYGTILRIIARIKRWFRNYNRNIIEKESGGISVDELIRAEQFTLCYVQYETFSEEIQLLNSGKQLIKSKIINFYPFLDKAGTLRVGGRLENADINYDMKHPIILPGNHELTKKLVLKIHLELLHAGPAQMLAHIRQRFQIIRGRTLVKKVIHECMRCHRYKLLQQTQLMGQLPYSRVHITRPFLQTGIDYAGPFSLKAHQQRNSKIIKGYLAIFVCMSTKAVHLELVTNLSTENFIAALKRFQSVRGICSDLFSDNGSNFVGAHNELRELGELLKSESVRHQIFDWGTNQGIKWHFIPPAAPTFGGLWEAAVKSCKHHIRRVIGETVLNYEELLTLLKQIEAILNSRPLFRDDEKDDPITPAHFLIGHPLTLMPEPNLMGTKLNNLSRWQMIQNMTQHIWKRWYQEYLTTLNKLTKWNNKNDDIKINDIVILRDDNLPPATWPLAKIIDVHPGKDNVIRVVTLKTTKGIYKRPVQKVCLLPRFDPGESREAGC